MCFSATASFGAGIVLTGIGAASIKTAVEPEQKLFASIPFLFGIQQISEGLLWLSLTEVLPESFADPGTYVFLFFAQILWPVWVPYSIYRLNKSKTGIILTAIGLLTSLYLAFCLLYYPVEVSARNYHIEYIQDYPETIRPFGWIFYIIATIVPPLTTKIKGMALFGLLILISCVATLIFYREFFVSIWCYFAALLSIAVYLIIRDLNMAKKESPVI